MNFDVTVQDVDGRLVSAIPIHRDGSVLVDALDLACLADPRAKIWLLGREQCHPDAYLAAQCKSDLQNT